VSEQAAELAYRYVARRERTAQELRQHLASRGLGAGEVEATVKELGEAGYLDDARYARLFVQDKRQLERWGSERIRRALLARGVDADVADGALAADEAEADDDETGRALALLQQRFPDPPFSRRDRERAYATLVRRGYDPELALDAIRVHAQGRPRSSSSA
jgi:regulatory protein